MATQGSKAGLPKTDCLVVAVTTPVTLDLRPDPDLLLARCRSLMTDGCDGITLFGTTGEGAEFAVADRKSTLERLVSGGLDASRVIVSVGALSIPDIVELSVHALDRKVAGLLLMPPCVYRGGITEDGTFRFYANVIERIARPDLRLYLYHFPDISGVPVTPNVVRRLDQRYPGRIAGVKDSSGDLDTTEALLRRFSHLSIFTGSEIHVPQAVASGARGTICGLANVMPRLMRAMMNAPTPFDGRQFVPQILAGDNILSRRPFIPSVKAMIADSIGAPAWRRVLPPMAEIPILEERRMIADFQRWEFGLAPQLRSLYRDDSSIDPKIVDIGGTFTDLVLLDAAGTCFSRKVASTPASPAEAVIGGIAQILVDARLQPADIAEVLHGTTVGSNTLLQKAGARTGLLTTRGFRDVLEIGRIRTPDMFDLTWDKPQPLVRRQWRREIDERIDARGRVLKALDEADVAEAGGALVADGVESIAICFINSYRNPAHEIAAEAVLRRKFPGIPVTTSVSVLPEQREYERTSTAAVNAYVLPVMQTYLRRLRLGLQQLGISAPLLVGNSNGGLSSVETAEAKPVFFISSGRSAGVVGAARLGSSLAKADIIVFDMGGTTASASLVQGGEIARATEYEFRDGISTPSRFIKAGGYMMSVPTIDVAEVGSGAGSIAWLDAGGLLHVGPVSAGAEPGPACYGRGGSRTTVTDANVALGLLPERLAGGAMRLDAGLARAAIDREIARPLGLSVDAAASGIRDVVNANMTRAIRAVTVERGVDPRDFTLLAFGGSGPLHGCDLALALDIPQVLFPRMPGVFTAMGMLTGDVEHYFIRSFAGPLRDFDPSIARKIIADLEGEAGNRMLLDGFSQAESEYSFTIDLRFVGQDSALPIPLPTGPEPETAADLRREFIARYKQLYHYASADAIESTSIRLLARGIRRNKLDFGHLQLPAMTTAAVAIERPAYFGRDYGWQPTQIIPRDRFAGPAEGPVIIESDDSTVVIPPGVQVGVDEQGNILAQLPRQVRSGRRERSREHV